MWEDEKDKVLNKEVIESLLHLQSDNIVTVFGKSKTNPNFKLVKEIGDVL